MISQEFAPLLALGCKVRGKAKRVHFAVTRAAGADEGDATEVEACSRLDTMDPTAPSRGGPLALHGAKSEGARAEPLMKRPRVPQVRIP